MTDFNKISNVSLSLSKTLGISFSKSISTALHVTRSIFYHRVKKQL